MRPYLAIVCLLVFSGAASAQDRFALHDGDRVVFFGDSITDQRLYTTFVETFAVTRFPTRDITFTHSGWGGDRVTGGGGGPIDVRLWRDVLPYNPTVVTIMLGMNDGRYRAFDQAIFDEYATGYKHIIDVLKRQIPGIRITAIVPSPYDDVTRAPMFEGGYNKVLLRYGDFLKDLAGSQNLMVADMNTSVVSSLGKAKTLNAEAAGRLIPDRIHPGPAGHLLMAQALLRDWGAPSLVTDVEIDAARKSVTKHANSQVSGVEASGTGISWSQKDRALPMPVNTRDASIGLALQASDFTDMLNQEMLRVRGLTGKSYKLTIDGENVGSMTAQELSKGVNLALLPTPMARQAAAVHTLTLRRADIHNARWRQVQVPLERNVTEHYPDALQSLDRLEQDLAKAQRAAAQPKTHRFELLPE